MRRVLKWFLWSFFGFAFLTAGLLVGAWMYEDEIKARAIAALNGGLITDLDVKSLDYSVVKHFPKVSLSAKNVRLMGTYGPEDTLLTAGELSFEVGLIRLLGGSMAFDQIRVSDGQLHMRKDAAGRVNWQVWNPSDSSSSSETAFDLERVVLENIDFSYSDAPNQLFIEALQVGASIGGRFEGQNLLLQGSIETVSGTVVSEGKDWVHQAPLKGSLSMEIDSEDELYTFNDLDLELAGVGLEGKAAFTTSTTGVNALIDARITSIDLSQLPQLLPAFIANELGPYALKGKGEGLFSMSGLIGHGRKPEWSASLALRNASAKHLEEDVSLADVLAELEVSGGGSSRGNVKIKHFSGYLEGGKLELVGSIDDFTVLNADLRFFADLSLADLQRFLTAASVADLTGSARMELSYLGALPFSKQDGNSRFDAGLLKRASYSGTAVLQGVQLSVEGLAKPLEDMTGRIVLDRDGASVERLAMRVGDSDFTLEGRISNILPWLLAEDQMLRVDAKCNSRHIDLASFISSEQPSSQSDDEVYHFALPGRMQVEVDASMEAFTFREFEARDLRGKVRMTPSGLLFDALQFESSGGRFLLSLRASPSENGFKIAANADLIDIDVQELFRQFENFGQAFLTTSHVRGQCTASALFQASMDRSLQIDPAKIYSSMDVKIENGELIGLQSMLSISDYMRQNRLIAPFVKADALEEKLRHIRFATFENRIEIRDERIYFPMMDIHSSVMDLKISGSHWFDNHIDYSVGLYLRDILVHKERTEYGVVEDDGLGHRFFLGMSGTIDEPVFSYDRAARKEVRREERREEVSEFKRILKEELNPFKRRGQEEEEGLQDQPSDSAKVDEKGKKPRWTIERKSEDQPVQAPADDEDDF